MSYDDKGFWGREFEAWELGVDPPKVLSLAPQSVHWIVEELNAPLQFDPHILTVHSAHCALNDRQAFWQEHEDTQDLIHAFFCWLPHDYPMGTD